MLWLADNYNDLFISAFKGQRRVRRNFERNLAQNFNGRGETIDYLFTMVDAGASEFTEAKQYAQAYTEYIRQNILDIDAEEHSEFYHNLFAQESPEEKLRVFKAFYQSNDSLPVADSPIIRQNMVDQLSMVVSLDNEKIIKTRQPDGKGHIVEYPFSRFAWRYISEFSERTFTVDLTNTPQWTTIASAATRAEEISKWNIEDKIEVNEGADDGLSALYKTINEAGGFKILPGF